MRQTDRRREIKEKKRRGEKAMQKERVSERNGEVKTDVERERGMKKLCVRERENKNKKNSGKVVGKFRVGAVLKKRGEWGLWGIILK